jgi:hypothetical protein
MLPPQVRGGRLAEFFAQVRQKSLVRFDLL